MKEKEINVGLGVSLKKVKKKNWFGTEYKDYNIKNINKKLKGRKK